MKNVFVINGFLEAGKTEFIRFTITQPYFQTTNTTERDEKNENK